MGKKMILFNTRNTEYLARQLSFTRGACIIKNFSDGELYVKVDEDVAGKTVCVLTATQPPADNILELFLLLDALKRKQAKIYLLFTYFGYARQDRTQPGEAFSSCMISNFLKTYELEKIFIIHAHSERLHEMLDFENVTPTQPVCKIITDYNLSPVAPDKGASSRVAHIARTCGVEPIFVTKSRPAFEKVTVTHIDGDVTGKNILIIDDMISTGSTILQTAALLKKNGANDIYAYATHGVFAPGCREKIEASPEIKKFYVTDSLPQSTTTKEGKITVINIAPFLTDTLNDL